MGDIVNNCNITNNKGNIYITELCKREKENLLLILISFISFDDLLNLSKSSKLLYTTITKKIIKKYSLLGCINDKSRKNYYMQMIDINKTKNLIIKELSEFKIKDKLYANILRLSREKKIKGDKVFCKVCEEIGRDTTRTFYTDKFVKGNGKEMLTNILTALAFIRPEIGYCQGMNFIAGALISYVDDEKIAFYIFLSFIDNIELNLLFLKNMPDYSIRVYQLNYYIKKFFPKLSLHFKKNQIQCDLFFSKWILVIFSSYLPFNVLCNVWDVFVIDKWKSIFKFSMGFLSLMHDDLLKMDLPKFSQYFKNNVVNKQIKFKDIAHLYSKFKITNKELESLREDFFMDQVKVKLEDPGTIWENDQGDYVNSYKNDLDLHSKKINKKTLVYKEKLERLNKEYEQANSSYEKQMKLCANLKFKVEVLLEMKISFENVINNFGLELKDNSKEKKKRKNAIMLMIHNRNDEIGKIEKKLKKVKKDIEKVNKLIVVNIQLLDKRKLELNKINKEKEDTKSLLENIFKESEQEKKELIKNLSEKLKLSAKFVFTSKY